MSKHPPRDPTREAAIHHRWVVWYRASPGRGNDIHCKLYLDRPAARVGQSWCGRKVLAIYETAYTEGLDGQ